MKKRVFELTLAECVKYQVLKRDFNSDKSNYYLPIGLSYDTEIDLANDEKHFEDLENERYARPSWQDTYFEIAKIIAKRSKDPHTKVGAVIVKDNHILGVGYNGEPRNFSYEFDWHSKEKYQYVIHAEMNAITNATTIGANVVGADIYLTLSPCTECMKLLIQNRIKTVYFLEKYTDFDKSQMMADNADIKLVHVLKGENK